MSDLNILPFFSITDNDDLLSLLWPNTVSETSLSINSSDLILNLPEHDAEMVSNWKPSLCKYITLDDLNILNSESFTITQVNTRSIKRNFDSFKIYLSSFKKPPSIITVSETWLNETDEIYYNLPNYQFISVPRKHRVGGDVGIYMYMKI